ncbi:hypothetical protein ACFWXK_22675 [Streptomyces sp. NPDC059070]|uniref:hypothetical protein n=1 Tax=Streptomyces sp. NPDC059070 TaxID=3346713 RepID=UPI0036B4012B
MPATAGTLTDSYLDALYETLRLYRHGPFSLTCPECRAQPGELRRARRSVHRARRSQHQVSLGTAEILLGMMGPGRPASIGEPSDSVGRYA